jgi:hypothetical protein
MACSRETDDPRTVPEEPRVQIDHISSARTASHPLDRLARALQDADRAPAHRPPVLKPRVRRLAAIVPARDYKLVGA